MDSKTTPAHRRVIRLSATGAALAATLLTGAAVSAQTPSASETPGTQAAPTVPSTGGAPGGQMGRGGQGFGQGGRGQGFGPAGNQGFGMRGQGGPGDVAGMGRAAVTVTSNDGTSLGLETADGWTRTIDTTNVVLTQDGTTIALGDISVGDRVSIAETRNADGSYTVTGIAVLPDQVTGSVETVGTDSFTVTEPDGTTQTVNVTSTTTWNVPGSTAPGIAALTVGQQVVAQGELVADGTLTATRVSAR